MRSSAGVAALSLICGAMMHASCATSRPGDAEAVTLLAEILHLEDRRTDGGGRLRALVAPDQDGATRSRAALAMGRIGFPVTHAADLGSLIRDADPTLRSMAAFALGEMEDANAVPMLAAALDDTEAGVRANAAEALGKLSDPSVVPRLLETIDDPDETVVTMALMSIWRLEPGPGVPAQAARAGGMYAAATTPGRRRAACYFLMRTQIRHPEMRAPHDAIRDAAADDDPLIRSWVARTLGVFTGEDADRAILATLAADADWRARVEAFNALRSHGVADWSVYRRGLADRHPAVALAALASLEGCPAPEARAHLEATLTHATPRYREVALTALARRDAERARARIEELAGDPAWSVRARLAEALAPLAASTVFATLSRDADPRVRGAAVAALAGEPRRPDADDRIGEALADPDVYVRAAALDALAATPGPAAAPAIVAALTAGYDRGLEDDAEEARLSALAGLGAATDASPDDAIRAVLDRACADPAYLVRRRAASILLRAFHVDRFEAVGQAETRLRDEDYLAIARRAGSSATARFETDAGVIRVALHTAEAPITVDNFMRLARDGALDGLTFHRVVPGFVIQDGDPRGDGNGGPPWRIRCEINTLRYGTGAVGMALSGKDTGGSQYFMTQTPQPHLDGGYTIFGQVIEGQDHVDATVQGDRIRRIVIEEEGEKERP